MVNVLLPMAMYMMELGRTIDLRNYGFGAASDKPIYNETHVLQREIMTFNASYYVLPDEKIPYDKLHLPIDCVLGMRLGMTTFIPESHELVVRDSFGGASILVVAEYKTFSRSLSADAETVPDWEDNVNKKDTHYVDEQIYGGRLSAVITIKPYLNKGDVQVLRRLVRETFGTSGPVTNKTVGLWRKFYRSLDDHPDLREETVQVEIKHGVVGAQSPPTNFMYDAKDLLQYAAEFSKYVDVNPESFNHALPILVHFKPLSDLDESYISLEKNVLAERYLIKLDAIEQDVRYSTQLLGMVRLDLVLENGKTVMDLLQEVHTLPMDIHQLFMDKGGDQIGISIYKDIDLKAFQKLFDKYTGGLIGNYSSYNELLLRLQEIGYQYCEDNFHKPTRGFLNVGRKEVVDHDNVDLEECKEECHDSKRCRAIAYSKKERKCWVYRRSTVTTPIELSEGDGDDVKIYDRICPY